MKIDVFQGGVIAHTAYGERLLSRLPSPAVQALMDIKPKLCNEISGRLTCGNTPLNFNGSLTVGLCNEVIANLYIQQSLCPPETILRPYEIINNVPLSYYDGAAKTYQPTQHIAPQILVKYGCGMPVGIVTQGELCGVIAELMDGVSPHEGLSITNMWSDERLTFNIPYLPYLHIFTGGQPALLLEQQVNELFTAEYRKKVQEIQGACPVMARGSHLLFKLCDELNIPIDKERFHCSYRT